VKGSDSRYNFNTLESSIKVIKQKPLKFKVTRKTGTDGATLSIHVMNKKTKKPLNGVKVKLQIYTGKKYKTITLKTKTIKGYKGVCGYSTNKLSVGKHKVKILPNTIKYKGSATSYMKITKQAKKHNPWESKESA
jgi:5-hydroxyisourate hydrolase-like protein (transthyretin family)